MGSSATETATSRGLGAALRPAHARILFAGGVLVGVFALLTLLSVAGQQVLWENVHWTIAAGAATLAAWTSVGSADPGSRAVRRWTAVALSLFVLAQAIWDVEVALDRGVFPSVADGIWLATAIPVFFAFRATIARELRPGERLAVYLDSAVVFLTIVAIFLQIGAGGARSDVVSQILLIAYPSVFFGTAAACVVSALASRARPFPGGAWAILAGLLVLGVAQAIWAMGATTDWPPGAPQNYLISVGLLLIGFGAATWTNAVQVGPRYDRLAGIARTAAPLVAVGAAAIVTVLAEVDSDESRDVAIHCSIALVVVLAAIRQVMVLRDRALANDELRAAQRGLIGALDGAHAAAERERRVAGERGRVLAASQRLLTASDSPGAISEVLGLVVPDGLSGFVSRWIDGGEAVRIIAATPDSAGGLVGRSAQLTELAFSIASAADDTRPRAYSARGRNALPDGLGWTDPPFGTTERPLSSALRLPLIDNDGRPLGALVLVDATEERVLEPAFLEYARLSANQLAIALQNADLVDRLKSQIDEIKRVQSQLIQASKLTAIGELAAAVAHEVNNPLTGVLGYTDLLLAEAPPDDPSRESLDVIRTETLRARSVIWALLDFARPRVPEIRPVDLGDLIHGAVDLSRRIEGGDITLVEDIAPLPDVELDESAIQQVLLNLITNACQAIVGTGTVTVAARQDGDEAVVTVRDDGSGMTDDVRDRMFEPFFTTKPMRAGRGLGLSVSLGFIESHHGTISVSTAPGVGTTVTVRLPLRAPIDTAARTSAAPSIDPQPVASTVGANGRQLELPVGEPTR